MVRLTLVVVAGLAACGGGRTADSELGALVVAPDDTIKPIDLARAVKDPIELGRAIGLPHHEVERMLGPHTEVLHTATGVKEGAVDVDALTVDTTIELGEGGSWHALSNNSADYGREAIWSGGALYLRPRYARWHKRAPNDAREPVALRDEYASELAAAWDLLAPGVELIDRGARQVGSRSGRVIEIKISPTPGKPPVEPLVQRKWRESRVVEAVSGEIVLDADKGVPLSAKLVGRIAYVRDGHKMTMTIEASEDVKNVGQPVAIALPPAEEVVATPERLREVDDRDSLLKNIAPPIRIQPDDDLGGGSGSAAAPPPPAPPAAEPGKDPGKASP